MENTTPIAVPHVAIFVPSVATTVDPTVASIVETTLPNPCRDIVLYQSKFQSFAKRYRKDQKRQLAFEASMYQMILTIKSTLLHHFPGDSLPDISLPEFHRDSFGASSDTSGSNAHVQGEPSVFAPVTSPAQPDLHPPADSSPVITATPLVSTGPPSQGESRKEQDQAAHIQ
ncbi:hypothetical protein CsatA_028789 [Cannabis sativa]